MKQSLRQDVLRVFYGLRLEEYRRMLTQKDRKQKIGSYAPTMNKAG